MSFSRFIGFFWPRLTQGTCAMALAISGAGWGTIGAAQTIDLAFMPPEVPAQDICVPGPSDTEMLARWDTWDQVALPDLPRNIIRRDLARLGYLDGVRWFETRWRAIELLEQSRRPPDEETLLVMRIMTLEQAGRFQQILDEGYVQTLVDRGDQLASSSSRLLSRLLRDGIGTERDVAAADHLLVKAAFSGNAQAMFDIAEMQLKGEAPSDWASPVELTVTSALSATLGALGSATCDRAQSIAAAYQQGRIVTPDPEIAQAWYRFAADLGDVHSAWRVVKYQMTADNVAKDNALLVRMLEKAAGAGLPHAQLELARVLEYGALMQRNMPRAQELLEAVASTGDIRGLVQYASFLRRQADFQPGLRPQMLGSVQRLSEHPDAPAWAFRVLADDVIDTKGYWAGRDKVLELLNKAVARGDTEAAIRVASMIVDFNPTPAQVNETIDILDRIVQRAGQAQPLKDILDTLMCRSTEPLDLQQVAFWNDRLNALSNTREAVLPVPTDLLDPRQNPFRIAQLQSDAIALTPSGWAEWRDTVARARFVQSDTLDYWAAQTPPNDAIYVAELRLALTYAETDEAREVLYAQLRAYHRQRGPDFAAEIDSRLFKDTYSAEALRALPRAAYDSAVATLKGSAERGFGRAMQALANLEPGFPERQALYAQFAPSIRARGDFSAQVFGVRYGQDPEFYRARARGIMPCTFGNMIEMVGLTRDMRDEGAMTRWIQIATVLADGHASRMTQMARFLVELGGVEAHARAFDFLERASAMGHIPAKKLLFDRIADADKMHFDPGRAADLLLTAVMFNNYELLTAYLESLSKQDPAPLSQIATQQELSQAYRIAVQSGEATPMRLFGQYLHDTATSLASLQESLTWLEQAADMGDGQAMLALGRAYAYGLGTPPDPGASRKWLDRAAEAGSETAIALLHLLSLRDGT